MKVQVSLIRETISHHNQLKRKRAATATTTITTTATAAAVGDDDDDINVIEKFLQRNKGTS